MKNSDNDRRPDAKARATFEKMVAYVNENPELTNKYGSVAGAVRAILNLYGEIPTNQIRSEIERYIAEYELK